MTTRRATCTCGQLAVTCTGEPLRAVPVGGFADPTFPAPRVTVYEARQHPWARLPDGMELERYD